MKRGFFAGFKQGMSDFGNTIAIIVNSALLLVVYMVGVGLTSLISKPLGKDFMQMRIEKKKKSYWTKLDVKTRHIDEHYRQF